MQPHCSERWAPIPGAPGYEVSTFGNVRHRKVYRVGEVVTRVDQRKGKGYRTVYIGRVLSVHRAVLLAFVGEPPVPTDGSPTTYAHHLDGDKANNRLENLRWVTSREHGQHHALYPI